MLGRIGGAKAAYSQAISKLPPGYLFVPLYNNRTMTHIKTGNMSGTVENCTAVVEFI